MKNKQLIIAACLLFPGVMQAATSTYSGTYTGNGTVSYTPSGGSSTAYKYNYTQTINTSGGKVTYQKVTLNGTNTKDGTSTGGGGTLTATSTYHPASSSSNSPANWDHTSDITKNSYSRHASSNVQETTVTTAKSNITTAPGVAWNTKFTAAKNNTNSYYNKYKTRATSVKATSASSGGTETSGVTVTTPGSVTVNMGGQATTLKYNNYNVSISANSGQITSSSITVNGANGGSITESTTYTPASGTTAAYYSHSSNVKYYPADSNKKYYFYQSGKSTIPATAVTKMKSIANQTSGTGATYTKIKSTSQYTTYVAHQTNAKNQSL